MSRILATVLVILTGVASSGFSLKLHGKLIFQYFFIKNKLQLKKKSSVW